MNNIYTETFKVHTYEVDMHNRLTIHSICQFLQESASNHASNLGLGVGYLLKNNRTWVLSKLAVDVKTPVFLGDTISIRTWPSGTKKLFYTRDFTIKNSGGETIAMATSYWLFLDTRTMRPVPPSKGEIDFSYGNNPAGFEKQLNKIQPALNNDISGVFKVRYSDLDLNNHVNNITYIKWIMEGIDPDFKKKHVPLTFKIDFLKEVKYGEEVNLFMDKIDTNHYFHTLKINETDVCRAESEWE